MEVRGQVPKLPSQKELSWRIAGYALLAIMGTICAGISIRCIVDRVPESVTLRAMLASVALAAGIGAIGEVVVIVKTYSLKKEILKADQATSSMKKAEDAKLVFRALGEDTNDTIRRANKQLNN